MIENKYYIPVVEEFHWDFKFEINQNAGKDLPEKWECLMFRPSVKWENLEFAVENKTVRVKYLDRIDIEELGWKFLTSGEYQISLCLATAINLTFYHNDKRILELEHIDQSGEREEKETWFKGRIKNKNELSHLMKQLGIK